MADVADANRKHFDSKAHEYDTKPWQQKIIAYVCAELRERRAFLGIGDAAETRLLDYACGPGTITKALSAHISSSLGIDLSTAMTSLFNARAADGTLPATSRALMGNLVAATPYINDGATGEPNFTFAQEAQFNDFDVCIVGLGFHHFDDYAPALRALSQRVKAGGVVGIVDLFPDQSHYDALTSEQKAMMHKSGFTAAEMEAYMAEAGLVDFDIVALAEPVVMPSHGKEIERRLFIARGRRPS